MFNSAFFENPYPFYAELRSQEQPVWSSDFGEDGAWLVSRHADASAALKNPRLSVARSDRTVRQLKADQQEQFSAFNEVFSRWMLFQNPPQHTDLRKLLAPAFSPSSLLHFRPRIESLVNQLLDKVAGKTQSDFIKEIAHPLPALVIADMLGIDPADRERFIKWSNDIAAFFGNTHSALPVALAAQRGILALKGYFRALLPQRRMEPGPDLISMLIRGEAEGRPISEDDLVAQCTLLLFAGHETTRNLLGNGLLALLRHPDQWQMLREDRRLLPLATKELLRYDSPVQCTARKLMDDCELGGRSALAGQAVVILIGSANHDSAVFTHASELDITRQEANHLSFGAGTHACIGAVLTYMEAEVAFNAVLDRLPDARLVQALAQWQNIFAFRGLCSLPLYI
jgi:cytochrome P450